MPAYPGPSSFLRDPRGFTGAEKALLICFGLAIIVVAGALVRGGSGRAAGDARRVLSEGSGGVGAIASTATLPSAGLVHAADTIAARPVSLAAVGAFARAGAIQEAAPPEAPEPAPPAAVPPPPLTIGDTAGNTRNFTDKVYQRNLKLVKAAKVSIPDAGMKGDLALFVKNWEKNQARYEAVAEKTGVPARLIAALHWRESTGSFNTYLHQGDPLGKPARHVPRNIPVFYKWEDAAIHALNMKKSIQKDLGINAQTTDVAAMATYSEYYNGLGYYNKGRVSPYVYSGTDQYSRGKYVADGVYDPNHRDRQLGVVTMIESIPAAPPVVVAPPAPPAPAPPAPVPPPPAGPGVSGTGGAQPRRGRGRRPARRG